MSLAFFLQYLAEDPVFYFTVVFAVILSVVLHELGHGVAAIWQGDDTPRVTGHMTLDPLVHMPPFSMVLLFVAGIAFGLMPVNPSRFRSRYGSAMVAAAGPAVNLILAFLGLTILVIWLKAAGQSPAEEMNNFQRFFFMLGVLNLVLCLFNMLPLPPLDGSTVLKDFSPGYRRFVSNPNNQPIFFGGFLLVFFFAGRELFDAAGTVASRFILLFW